MLRNFYKKCFVTAVLCTIAVLLAGCSQETITRPDSPIHTSHMMKLAIDAQDYEQFQALFTEHRKNYVSKSDFKRFGERSTAGAGYTNFEVLSFENGEMLLVRLTPPNERGEVEIEDVKIVPEEMRYLFQS